MAISKTPANGWVTIESLKKGDAFKRNPDTNITFNRAEYCRYSKKYEGKDVNDWNRYCYWKKGSLVFINFEY